ncbi:MAG: TolC family protein [Pirellulales bacterium]
MHLAGADLLSAADDDDEFSSGGGLRREGSSRPRQAPSLMAAANSADDAALDDAVDDGDAMHERALPATDAGPLAALSAIGVSGETSSDASATVRDRKPASHARRPARAAPTGPVSIFADDPLPTSAHSPANYPSANYSAANHTTAKRSRRGDVALAAAQEDVPASNGVPGQSAPRRDDGDDDLAPAATMSVEQIVNIAAREHPLLRQRQEEIKVAEAGLVGASAYPNPQLVMDTDTPTQEAGPTEVSTRLTWTILLGGKRNLAQQVADLGIRRAQLAASRETEFIVDQAVAAALEVLYWQELVVLQAAQFDLANDLVSRAQPPVVPESDRITASVSATGMELLRLDSVRELRAARFRLSKAMGLNPPRAIRVTGTLSDRAAPKVDLDTLLAAVRENRPEIAEAQLGIAQSRRQLALEMAKGIPDIELGPRYRDTFREPSDSMGARFSTDLPLFDRNQGGVAESSANIRLSQATMGVVEMSTLSDVAEAFAELSPLQSRLAYYRSTVPKLTADAEDAIRDAYKIGKIDFNKVVSEQQRLARLKIEHLKLRYQYNRLRARIELYAGRSLERLAEMEATGESTGQTDNPFENSDPPAAQREVSPGQPRPHQGKAEVDSRVARTKSRSGVVPTSGVSTEEPPVVSPLDYVKRLTKRKESPAAGSLPYAAAKATAKPSAAARR